MKKLLLILCVLISYQVQSQISSKVIWEYQPERNDLDLLRYVEQTNDNSFVMAGYAKNIDNGDYDGVLIKVDAYGKELWQKTFATSSNNGIDIVRQTSDGGFILGAYTTLIGTTDWNLWIIKTDSEGEIEWDKVFGGVDHQGANSIEQLSDGSYIIGGFYYGAMGVAGYSDRWYMKIDAEGNEIWSVKDGQDGWDIIWDLEVLDDGSYVFAGITGEHPNSDTHRDLFVSKFAADGTELWTKIIDINDQSMDGHANIELTNEGNLIVAGYSQKSTSSLFLLELDLDGNQQWLKLLHGQTDNISWVQSLQVTEDNGFLIGCSRVTSVCDFTMIKTNNLGEEEWFVTHNAGGYPWELVEYAQELSNQQYAFAGTIYNDNSGNSKNWKLAKLCVGESPEIISYFESDVLEGSSPLTVNFQDISFDFLTGITNWYWDFDNDGVIDSEEQNPQWIYAQDGKYSVSLVISDGSIYDTLVREQYITVGSTSNRYEESLSVSIYPNPAKTFIQLTGDISEIHDMKIYDIMGNMVKAVPFNSNQKKIYIGELPTGIYFFEYSDNQGYKCVSKIVKQ